MPGLPAPSGKTAVGAQHILEQVPLYGRTSSKLRAAVGLRPQGSRVRLWPAGAFAPLSLLLLLLATRSTHAYVDCTKWYGGKWNGAKPNELVAEMQDSYWITFGPAGDISPSEVKTAYRGWTHCGPAVPDVVSR